MSIKEIAGTWISMSAAMVINYIYFDPLASTPDRARLLSIARAWDPGITREQLDNWIDNMREDLLTRIYYDRP